LNAPRYALPIGVRAVETMTASRMTDLRSLVHWLLQPFSLWENAPGRVR